MPWLFAILIVGFLVWAGGRETRWGGLGLLWRVAAWFAGLAVVAVLIGGLYVWQQNNEYVKKQEIQKTEDEKVGARIKIEYPAYKDYSDEEIGKRMRTKNPILYNEKLNAGTEALSGSQSQNDPFPFSDSDAQYNWYDRHNVPMSDRCYTTMTPPCSELQWKKATSGQNLTPEEETQLRRDWCAQFAKDWGQTFDECMNPPQDNSNSE